MTHYIIQIRKHDQNSKVFSNDFKVDAPSITAADTFAGAVVTAEEAALLDYVHNWVTRVSPIPSNRTSFVETNYFGHGTYGAGTTKVPSAEQVAVLKIGTGTGQPGAKNYRHLVTLGDVRWEGETGEILNGDASLGRAQTLAGAINTAATSAGITILVGKANRTGGAITVDVAAMHRDKKRWYNRKKKVVTP